MKRGKRWLVFVSAALLLVLVSQTDAAQPFKKVSIATTAKASKTSSTTTTAPADESAAAEASESTPEAPSAAAAAAEEYDLANDPKSENAALKAAAAAAAAKNSSLTGIPQIDYIWDPNLPRELRGYNLSNYPFYESVPEEKDITFECEGHHDGFYASIEHKCQVYHHCVYGIRHDFLCANFTAFDQKTFICHFVSDVDCDNSYKYWNRNDDLYMATTTTAKPTTSTEEPPPTPRRRPILRPNRPLRRPSNRRPVDDDYYEDEEYYDDYYEERLTRRRKQRPRKRKPVVEYEDEYDDVKAVSEEERPLRRPGLRNRPRIAEDEQDVDDYDVERPKSRSKPSPALSTSDRRKVGGRKPGSIASRPSADERRSFNDDRPILGRKTKPLPVVDEPLESEEVPVVPPRRLTGARRRIGEKRTSAAPALELDVDEKLSPAVDADPTAEEEQPVVKEKTTPKPLEEFVTPKPVGSSVYARPRAPPRIALPVPVNEKKKFQYPVQKSSATTANPAAHADADEEYYEDDLYEEPVVQKVSKGRRRNQAAVPIAAQLDEEDVVLPIGRRRLPELAARKPTRTTLRKPVTDKKLLVADEDVEYDAINERQDTRTSARKRPIGSRNRAALSSARGAEDVDFVDDDYEDRPLRPAHRLRPNKVGRKGLKKRPVIADEEDEVPLDEAEPERPLRSRTSAAALPPVLRRKNIVTSQRLRQSTAAPLLDEVVAADTEEELEEPELLPVKSSNSAGRQNAVRVVKRPFLPSRGGSPYLPRGLQPVGVALKSQSSPQTTESTPIDMGSTISGVRLLEHGAPILRDSLAPQEPQRSRSTLPSREPPVPSKITLDELYENDYDVTLNDALNPTLKPLTSSIHRRNFVPSAFASSSGADASVFLVNNKQSPAFHQLNNNKNNYQNQDHLNVYQTLPHSSAYTSSASSVSASASASSSSPSSLSSSSTSSQTHLQQQHNNHQLLQQQQHQQHQQQQLQQQQHQQQQQLLSNYNSDSYFSSTDNRRRTIGNPPSQVRSSRDDYRAVSARIAQHFYDDLDY